MKEKIWLSPPHMGGGEMKYIQEAFDTNWIAPIGPNVDAFEEALRVYTGSKYAVALSSGTAALHLALIVLGVQKGDIVLCQSLTFIASASPIVYLDAIPVFIDSEPTTWNICPEALETAIKFYLKIGKKPKAVIIVHLYGMPARLTEILFICRRYGIPIIEDAAEALGSVYEGKKLGTFGDIGILSFNGNKIITTSGGGAMLSNNVRYIEKARFLSGHSKDNAPHYQHSQTGYNYRMSNICAGIGRGQMEVLTKRIDQRRTNFQIYKHSLENVPGILFQEEYPGAFSNRWLTAITIDQKVSKGVTNNKIQMELQYANIESRLLWKPMHLQPAFRHSDYFGRQNASNLFQLGLCLPSGSNLTKKNISNIAVKILKVFNQKKTRIF
jgi:dTDP-4-amino-4,6-dideoxygalactose transaminase